VRASGGVVVIGEVYCCGVGRLSWWCHANFGMMERRLVSENKDLSGVVVIKGCDINLKLFKLRICLHLFLVSCLFGV
jgi:hypothetical protein